MSGPRKGQLLKGKVAVVTGSTRGLGRAIAERCAREGARVVVSSRHAEAVEEAVQALRAQGLEAVGLACDVGVLEQARALAARAKEAFGGFDIWVNNAAQAGPFGPTAHVPPEAFAATLQTNVFGTYFGSLVALEHLLPKGRGRLVNLLGRGDRQPVPLQNAYASSKAWVRAFTRALAAEYRDSGVGIHALNPGLVDTDLLRRIDTVQGYEGRLSVMPTLIRMWARPPEVAAGKALALVGPATEGRTGLEVHAMGPGHMLGGALRVLFERVTRKRVPPVQLDIRTLPPHL